jgi:fructokinase
LLRRARGNGVKETFAGVELGGTKCVAILARGPDEIIEREAMATTVPNETLPAIEDVLRRWRAQYGFAALGIASFGPLDLDPGSPGYGRITSTPKPGWAGADVRQRLAQAAGTPTAFDTDVNGAALAEMRWGAGRGFDDFAYITVGTGVGVGLIVNGRPTRGFAHCELGHIRVARLEGDTFAGSCPFHGACVEGLAAGPSRKARLGDGGAGEPAADDPMWESVAWAIAQLCHAIVCAAAPRAIAVGGGVVENQPHLLERVQRMLVDSLNGYMELPERAYVRAPALGSNAGPLGAIAIAMTARP